MPQAATEPKTIAELEKEATILLGGKPKNLERLSIGTLVIGRKNPPISIMEK